MSFKGTNVDNIKSHENTSSAWGIFVCLDTKLLTACLRFRFPAVFIQQSPGCADVYAIVSLDIKQVVRTLPPQPTGHQVCLRPDLHFYQDGHQI